MTDDNETTITKREAIERATEADNENEVCPECGDDYLGVDMTGDGNLYYIHEDNGATVDGCEVETEVDGIEW